MDRYAFSHAPGHTMEHTLPNSLEVAHPSTPVNERVHSPPGLCVPYICVCIADGVPCALDGPCGQGQLPGTPRLLNPP